MATRHERVVIDLDDRFTSPMARATASTAMFRRELDSSGKQVIAFDKTTKDTSPTIDRLSGRLAILGRTAAALGPGLIPITTALTPALAGMATQLGFVAAGAGTAVLAFKGVGDGLKALNEYQLDPTEANLKKMREEMGKLGPDAQRFVHFLDGIGPALSEIREAAQGGLLPGVQEGIESLLTRAPQVRRIVGDIADASGDLVSAMGADLASDRWDEFFRFLENEARPALSTFGHTVGNVASGLAELWMAMDPLSDDFTGGLLKASESFEAWAASLSETQGFQDFLAYVRDTAPQVMETLGSLANALLQIGEAAAPLGGPVLHILEAVADVVAAIADSDLGTPIMGAIGAFSALSLASRGFASVTNSNAVASVKTLTGSLRTMGDVGIVAWGQSAKDAERFNTATGRVKSSLAGFGKSAALVGGMALATSDLGDSMGVANTMSLALMGTMAGPWGAAVGAGAGLVMDLAAANDALTDSIDAARAALDNSSLDYEQQKAAVEAARAELEAYQADLALGGMGSGGFMDKLKGNWTQLSDLFTNSGEEGKAAVEDMEAELRQMPRAISSSEAAFRRHAEAIEANVNAMRSLREERLRARNAELNYEASIDDATGAAKENGKTLDKTTEKGRANWQALLGLAEGWNGLSDRMQNADGAHKRAIDTFTQVAVSMGMEEDKARDLAKRLMEIPPERKTAILVDAGAAFRVIDGVRVALRNLDGTVSETYIRTVHQNIIENKLAGGGRSPGGNEFHGAMGGTVPGQRYPYGDKIHAMLAPGEEIISNRYGQADRHRALLQAINANRYANGGTVGGSGGGAHVTNNYGHSGPMRLEGELMVNGQWTQMRAVATSVYDAERRHDRATGRG